VKLTTLKPRLTALVTQRIPTQAGTERLRGRAAVERRKRWLEAHPLCVECEKAGMVSAASVVDHRIPLWKGGADSYETNGQSLCVDHHDEKTKIEAAERSRGGS
jgi:5-methylcytosine-specific restriction protein A